MTSVFQTHLQNASLVLRPTTKPPSTTFSTHRIVQEGIYLLIFVLSIAGNGAMLTIFCRRSRVQSDKDILLVNMIVAESAVAATSVPFDFALLLVDQRWVFGPIMCYILWPVQTASFGALVFTLTAMSTQRYQGIVHPMKKKTSIKATKITVAAIWLVSLILVVPYGVFLRFVDGECSETWGSVGSQVYTLGLFTFHYVIPLVIISFCYARIAFRIRSDHKHSAKIVSGTKIARMKRSRRHNRAARMVIMFIVVFAVCMLPHHAVWLWITFGANVPFSEDLLTFSYMFTFTSSFANPLVYFTHNPAFKARLLRILCRRSDEQNGRSKTSSLLVCEDSAESRL